MLELAEDVHVDGAVADAASAADAGADGEFLDVVVEFVLDSLAPAGGLVGTGVVARGVEGEEGGLTGVPVFAALAAAVGPLVHDVEAVAGGAEECAAAAAPAFVGEGGPAVALEVGGEPGRDGSCRRTGEAGAWGSTPSRKSEN